MAAPTPEVKQTLPTRRAVLASGLAAALPVRAVERQVLTVAAFPLIDKIVEAAAKRWKQRQPGVELKVFSRQYADHHTAMTTALSTSSRLPDVMALEVSYVGRFAQGEGLQDLRQPPYGIERFRDRYVTYAYDQATTRSGAVVAAPADVGPGTMLVRHDLLQRAGVDIAEMAPSWDAYIAAGLRIKSATGAYLVAHVAQVKDILIRVGLRPGEGVYFDQESRVLVNTPRFARAFQVAQRIRQQGLDARVSAWSNEWAEALRRGGLATELSGAWIVGQLSAWIAPATAGLWRASQFPEGAYAGYGGAFYALPRRADPARRALAWEFVQMMTLEADLQAQAFRQFDAFPALRETHTDPFFEEPLPFLGGQRARQLWREATRHIPAAPVHKQNGFADEVVGTELDNVLERGKSIAEALVDAEQLLLHRARR